MPDAGHAVRTIVVGLDVLGSRGIGGSPAQLLGSTSSQVAQQAPCPVTIVPGADRTARQGHSS